ncbi:MAG: hypothetical protein KKC79_07960 [Gammaproteobacteria bacterium]|nr:hypothetical protein [Gammaproteobacteria bacterium]MBU1444119.1 hypothetical protein [Gammaproteobacteria bacterium]MBU2408570.1 hypothetical protein [Gammaproteobacteria bacterium]
MNAVRARSACTRAVVCALAFAVWAATTLGVLHGAVHNPVALHALPGAVHATSAPASHHGLKALFGEHGKSECRLYDQLSHGPAALCVPMLFAPLALPLATFAWLEGEALARWVALFEARGPPSIR